ncbi:HEPN domain-containing protein [Candidatus Woesearchaeota archaeon]|nr:HEPN domain-containing protein [Candidatus Woesearchaeota archaeon]
MIGPFNRIMLEEVKRWISKAESDLKNAEDNLNINNYELSSFLSQQAVEKALKSLQIKTEKKFTKTHDILFLAKKLNLPKKLLNHCDKLNPVYIETRYPDASGEFASYTKEESEEDLGSAKEVLAWIGKKL